jgi:hypothetical protein
MKYKFVKDGSLFSFVNYISYNYLIVYVLRSGTNVYTCENVNQGETYSYTFTHATQLYP